MKNRKHPMSGEIVRSDMLKRPNQVEDEKYDWAVAQLLEGKDSRN